MAHRHKPMSVYVKPSVSPSGMITLTSQSRGTMHMHDKRKKYVELITGVTEFFLWHIGFLFQNQFKLILTLQAVMQCMPHSMC